MMVGLVMVGVGGDGGDGGVGGDGRGCWRW